MPSNVDFKGGTTDQHTAISQAHSDLIQAVQTAQQQSASGGGDFATWFGPATDAAKTAVSDTYGEVSNALQNVTFTYDLTQDLSTLLIPNVCLLFVEISDHAVTANVWGEFWPNYYLDHDQGENDLVLSILHEICVAFAMLLDFARVADEDTARELVDASPTDAMRCPFNYMYYLRGLREA